MDSISRCALRCRRSPPCGLRSHERHADYGAFKPGGVVRPADVSRGADPHAADPAYPAGRRAYRDGDAGAVPFELQLLDLYVCLRPVRWFQGVPSPVRHPEKLDVVIFRENTEDIYAGVEWAEGTPEVRKVIDFLQREMGGTKMRFPKTSGIGIKPISIEGTERLIRAALDYTIARKRKSLTIVHKGNIM